MTHRSLGCERRGSRIPSPAPLRGAMEVRGQVRLLRALALAAPILSLAGRREL